MQKWRPSYALIKCRITLTLKAISKAEEAKNVIRIIHQGDKHFLFLMLVSQSNAFSEFNCQDYEHNLIFYAVCLI